MAVPWVQVHERTGARLSPTRTFRQQTELGGSEVVAVEGEIELANGENKLYLLSLFPAQVLA